MTGIYADHNATAPLAPSAKLWMSRALEAWGNPSSSHAVGRQALELIEKSRKSVADALGVSSSEVVFTSGGSEANVAAILGSYLLAPKDFKLLVSSVEHSSIRDLVENLRLWGAKVTDIPVTPAGLLDLAAFRHTLESGPHLVSVMAANNETGVVFPIAEVLSECQSRGIPLHVDAVQTFGKLPPEVWNGADFVSVSAHKIGGPKGMGALIVKKGRQLQATHFGGAQEIKRRGGTENVLGILGFGGACVEMAPLSGWERIRQAREKFESDLKALGEVDIQGEALPRLPNTTSVRVRGIEAEVLLSALDLDGICISAGSACSSGSITPSHVLLAMGLSKEAARECLRISWGLESTDEEIAKVTERLAHHIQRIRSRRRYS